MLVFLITCCLSFILLNQSLSLKPLPPSAHDMRLLSLCFWKDLPFYPITKSIKNLLFLIFSSRMSLWKKNFISNAENFDMKSDMSVLDLPDLVLECILEKLPPEGLCKMACVCTHLRERCMSGHLWEKHITNKWARIVGPAAYREWRWHIASRKCSVFFNQKKQRAGLVFNQQKQRAGLVGYLTHVRPLALIRSSTSNFSKRKNLPQVGSIMSWYCALESGKFWFHAQVYNRENGHVGFVLSCYDAELSYNQQTDTFQARYPPLGRRASALEAGVTWDRLRAPPVDTSPHELHISECLNDLQPGDHIEIQWRRNKEFPYGWWYGVVGHLETCDRDANHCQCQNSDTLVLEFNQYTRGSHWRQTAFSRKDHREEGNEADGFYGGIRKLYNNEEISMWRKLWPAEILE